MAKLHSALYQGHVMHHRFTPVRHRFIYKVFSACIDLDELPRLDDLRLFSVNRFNLFSFHEKDHGGKNNNLAGDIRRLLIRQGYSEATHRIKLLCYPRILGYTFNPLSVYFCYDRSEQVAVILYEVSNTFGSRHTYLFPVDGDDPLIRHHCDKAMYVSPFTPMKSAYHFRIHSPDDRVAVCIRQTEQSPEQATTPLLHATFTGERRTLTDSTLLSSFIRYPLMTLKVISAIHWEALKLWCKKLKIQPRDKNQTRSISWQDENGVAHYENL